MTDLHFTNLLIVCVVGFAAPFALGLVPALRLPAVVLELIVGIVIGPAGLDWVHVDDPVAVLALIGLAYLLFLSGLEIEFDKLRGRLLRTALLSFVVSIVVGVGVGLVLKATNQVASPLFVAIVLSGTSLGVVVPVLKDSGVIASPFGQLLIAAASIADVATIILLSLFFSRDGSGIGATLVLLGLLALLALAISATVLFSAHSRRIGDVLSRLQDTTAQIRLRAAFMLLIGFAAAAQALGLEVILGTFIAGALLSVLDHDKVMSHPLFRTQAGGRGLRDLHPGVLRDQRPALRPRRADVQRLDGGARAAVPRVPADRARRPRPAALPPRCGLRAARAHRGAPAVHLAALHHRRDRRRHRPRDHQRRDGRGDDRRRPAQRPAVPAHGADAAAARWCRRLAGAGVDARPDGAAPDGRPGAQRGGG